MLKIVLLFTSLLFSGIYGRITAGGENRPTGSRSASLGNASVAITDIWSVFNNQAGLARIRDAECGISYENRFLLKELGYSALAIAYPVNPGTVGFSAGHFGFSSYNETNLGLAYANSFGKYLAFGLQLDYHVVRLAGNNEKRSFITFEAGMILNLTQDLIFGAHVYNPASVKLADYNNERVPAIISMGFSFALSDNISLLAEAEKSMSDKATLNTGIEFSVSERFQLRAGLSTGQSAFSFGAGFETAGLLIGISTSWNTLLGYSPQISISYKF